jgi:hypothetical protein
MPTDDNINADVDPSNEDHQPQEGSDDEPQYDTEKAVRTLSRKQGDTDKKLSSLDSKLDQLLAANGTSEDLEEEGKTDDEVQPLTADELDKREKALEWRLSNKKRVEALPEEAQAVFKDKLSRGYESDDALALAESHAGITDSRPTVQSTGATGGTVNRGKSDDEFTPTPEERRDGVTKEMKKKYKDKIRKF